MQRFWFDFILLLFPSLNNNILHKYIRCCLHYRSRAFCCSCSCPGCWMHKIGAEKNVIFADAHKIRLYAILYIFFFYYKKKRKCSGGVNLYYYYVRFLQYFWVRKCLHRTQMDSKLDWRRSANHVVLIYCLDVYLDRLRWKRGNMRVIWTTRWIYGGKRLTLKPTNGNLKMFFVSIIPEESCMIFDARIWWHVIGAEWVIQQC